MSKKYLIYLVSICFFSLSSYSQDNYDNQIETSKNVVSGQLEAFKSNDALKAFSFAAPIIKAKFETPEIFMKMVETAYEPVSNPKNYFFLKSKIFDSGVLHQVQIISQKNQSYIATYSLILSDGNWKISGCTIAPLKKKSI
ncbi:MAG: DUF4864 domain-containing protein [Pelagibacteraceae bacterium]|nr:DUF4864 domain-containing protein [Pelagibacteraceae bacterium]|tara:strand:+ start:666 stop:1088 length:423 start_codon:yes stop_codon:yes gene_type:complete